MMLGFLLLQTIFFCRVLDIRVPEIVEAAFFHVALLPQLFIALIDSSWRHVEQAIFGGLAFCVLVQLDHHLRGKRGRAEASITIFGDITSWPWLESDVSSWLLSQQLEQLDDVEEIDVFINSYGGEVAEGWAIYNALKRHKAKIHTYAEGFACSIASVIFMAGEERTMESTSLLMIHQPWGSVRGNANDLEKEAEALRKMNEMSANAYKERINISDEELAALIDGETWITPEDAVRMGFATDIGNAGESGKPSQSVWDHVISQLLEKAEPAQTPAALDPERVAELVVQRLAERQGSQQPQGGGKPPENPIFKFLSAL